MTEVENDALQSLISDIVLMWKHIPLSRIGYNWKILISGFNLEERYLTIAGHIETHQNNENHRIMEQAISALLNGFVTENPSIALQIMKALAKDIVNSVPWDYDEKKYLEDRFHSIFALSKIPFDQDFSLVALIGQQQSQYIIESGFSDFFLRLVREINITFSTGCYTSTAFLVRKLLESIVVSTLMKEYGATDKSKYLTRGGRTKGFEKLCEEFWSTYENILSGRLWPSSTFDISGRKDTLETIRNDFNIIVHVLTSFKKRDDLVQVREDLQDLVDFLWNVYQTM